MKRNLHFFAAAVATISILASCAKEMEETTPNEESEETTTVPSGEMVTITFKADYPNPVMEGTVAPQQAEADTRTTIAEDGTVAWEVADEITLYYMEGETVASAPATALTAGVKADFQVTIPEGVAEVFAVYPAGKGELTPDGVFKVKTGGAQNGSFEQANYAAAWAEVSDEMNLSFKNVVGLFRVKLPEGGIIEDGDVNHTIKSISIAGKKSEPAFLGDVTVTVGDDGALAFSAPENAATEAVVELDEETRNAGYAYIPSLPVTSADGLVFRFMNTEGIYLPAAVTKDDKAITLDRGHLKPVNTACESVIFDWYFAENAEGDGKSADSPAGVADFQKLINDSQYLYGERRLDGARLNLAAGMYSLTEQLNIQGTEAGDITIVGAGVELSLVDGAALGTQMVVCASAKNVNLKNFAFQNGTSSANGGVMNNSGSSGKLICQGVGFKNNYSTKNSGAIYLGGTSGAEFRNCEFIGNKTNANVAGAVATGGSSKGTVAFYDCIFEGNQAGENSTATKGSQGGAVYHAAEDLLIVDNCLFKDNAGYAAGGALYGNTAKSVMFISRSCFRNNTVTIGENKDGGAAIYGKVFGVYNSTFSYNHHASKHSSSIGGENFIVANSTLVESMKSTIGVIRNSATTEHITTVVNSIVLTTSGTADHCALGTWKTDEFKYLDCKYNAVTRIDSRIEGAYADATNYQTATKATFGFDEVDLETKSFPWNGDITGLAGYSNCKLADVESLIKANVGVVGTSTLGVEFWNWLTTTKTADGLSLAEVDVRGIRRDPDLMWPGSYQDILQQSTESEE